MTFKEWWRHFNSCCPLDITDEDIAKWAWEAAWDQQQRVIDEMHLMFKDHVLVPKEPTEEMVEEACRTDFNFYDKNIRRAWKVMLQMAQEE
jgi:hypothetical protein